MTEDFLGSFENSINKQRVIIPSAFKKLMAQQGDTQVIVTLGKDDTVHIYPMSSWKETKAKSKESSEEKDKHLWSNLTFFAMEVQQMEENGRVRIREDLMKLGGLVDKVVIKGEGHFISVWNPERFKEAWQKRLTEHKQFTVSDYQL